MKTNKNIEIVEEGGLQCDNKKCDYVNASVKVEDYQSWVDAPCPDCGENLLTQEDADDYIKFRDSIDLINTIPAEDLKAFHDMMNPGGQTTDDILDDVETLKEAGITRKDTDEPDRWTYHSEAGRDGDSDSKDTEMKKQRKKLKKK